MSFSGVAHIHAPLLAWYASQQRDLPWRRTRNPYAILVSEIMLQQTQVDRVIPKYLAFMAAFPSLEALAAAPVAEVIRLWSGLGYNRRAVNLQRAAIAAVERFGGTLPADPVLLNDLPGIGRYTAGAVACFAYEIATPVVDTNVKRVLARLTGKPEPLSEREAWDLATAMLPPDDAYPWNQALMDLGATICTASSPACLICPMLDVCQTRGVNRIVAETKPGYRAVPFEQTRRYFRGQVVSTLRSLSSGETITLEALGPKVKPDYSSDDLPWLNGLVNDLVRDGLAKRNGEELTLP